jgi:hypothetical protein
MWIIEAYPYQPVAEPKPARALKKFRGPEAQRLWDARPDWSQRRLAKEVRMSLRALQLLNLTPPPGREKYAKKRRF